MGRLQICDVLKMERSSKPRPWMERILIARYLHAVGKFIRFRSVIDLYHSDDHKNVSICKGSSKTLTVNEM